MTSYDKVMRRITSLKKDVTFGPAATEPQVAFAEDALGCAIRGQYRRFLLDYGWARIKYVELFGLGSGVPWHLDLVRVTQRERTELAPALRHDLLPIWNDGGGNLHCVDTRSSAESPILFWDHTDSPGQECFVEAANFGKWLQERLEVMGL